MLDRGPDIILFVIFALLAAPGIHRAQLKRSERCGVVAQCAPVLWAGVSSSLELFRAVVPVLCPVLECHFRILGCSGPLMAFQKFL